MEQWWELQRVERQASTEQSWGIMAEFFHIPANEYEQRLMQRIAVEAAIEHRETREAMDVIIERRMNDIDMDTFLDVAQYCHDHEAVAGGAEQEQPAGGVAVGEAAAGPTQSSDEENPVCEWQVGDSGNCHECGLSLS